jgi:hypothetical protein
LLQLSNVDIVEPLCAATVQFVFFVIAPRDRESAQNIIGFLLANYSTRLRATGPRERRAVSHVVRR